MDQAMTPEQKAMVMQFMGQTYGAMHKQDQNIVGQTANLGPKSHEMKNIFEQTARMPVVNPNMVNQSPSPQAPPASASAPPPVQEIKTVTPEEAAQEIAGVYHTDNPVDDQGEFDFSEPPKIDQLIELIKEQTLILKDISVKLGNGKSTKTKRQK